MEFVAGSSRSNFGDKDGGSEDAGHVEGRGEVLKKLNIIE